MVKLRLVNLKPQGTQASFAPPFSLRASPPDPLNRQDAKTQKPTLAIDLRSLRAFAFHRFGLPAPRSQLPAPRSPPPFVSFVVYKSIHRESTRPRTYLFDDFAPIRVFRGLSSILSRQDAKAQRSRSSLPHSFTPSIPHSFSPSLPARASSDELGARSKQLPSSLRVLRASVVQPNLRATFASSRLRASISDPLNRKDAKAQRRPHHKLRASSYKAPRSKLLPHRSARESTRMPAK